MTLNRSVLFPLLSLLFLPPTTVEVLVAFRHLAHTGGSDRRTRRPALRRLAGIEPRQKPFDGQQAARRPLRLVRRTVPTYQLPKTTPLVVGARSECASDAAVIIH